MDNKRERRDEEEKTAEATINLCFNPLYRVSQNHNAKRNKEKVHTDIGKMHTY